MKSKRPNRIDIVLIVLLLAAIVLYVWHVYGERVQRIRNNVRDITIDMTVEVESLRDAYSDHIRVGDAVMDANGNYIGSVTAVSFKEQTKELSNGTEALYPGYRRMTVTCRCDALFDGDTYRVGGRTVVVGDTYELAVPRLSFSGVCKAVKSSEAP